MPKRFSTARGREFGAGLRAAITGAGLTSRAAADIVEWDEAKVSDVVNGKGGATQLEVAVLLGVCRVNADEVVHLLSLHGETHIRGWWQQHGKCSPHPAAHGHRTPAGREDADQLAHAHGAAVSANGRLPA